MSAAERAHAYANRQLTAEGDAGSALDEGAAFTRCAEAERFQPEQHERGERVVDLSNVDVAGLFELRLMLRKMRSFSMTGEAQF